MRRAAVWTERSGKGSRDPERGQGARRARLEQRERTCRWGPLRQEAAEGPSRGIKYSDPSLFKHHVY